MIREQLFVLRLVLVLLVLVGNPWHASAEQNDGQSATSRLTKAYGSLVRDKDYKSAFEGFSDLANEGCSWAQIYLAQMYLEAQGVQEDASRAKEWFARAAQQDNMFAQHALAIMLMTGTGGPQDYASGHRWMLKAADAGLMDAQIGVALDFMKGMGTEKNLAEAARWLKRAADQGLADAQLFLGLAYLNGDGVPQNYAVSHMWLNLAAANLRDDDNRKLAIYSRNMAERKMSRADVSAAQQRAREWKPKPELVANSLKTFIIAFMMATEC
jgi:hypothetical protein